MTPTTTNHAPNLGDFWLVVRQCVHACARPLPTLCISTFLLLPSYPQAADGWRAPGPQVQMPEPVVIVNGSANDLGSDCTGCPELVAIPGGRYTRYSPTLGLRGKQDFFPPSVPHAPKPDVPNITPPPGTTFDWVEIRPFAMGKYEVTWDEWELCVSEGGCKDEGLVKADGDNGWGKGRRPVINVSWRDAQNYVRWLSNKTGKAYRLPSETEWEFAARAGTTTLFSWGNEDPVCDPAALNGAVFSGCERRGAWPVGSFRANGFGLHDMHGNIMEWTEDCYAHTSSSAKAEAFLKGSERLKDMCSMRVVRGGSWVFEPQLLRSAFRDGYSPDFRFIHLGFRVARSL